MSPDTTTQVTRSAPQPVAMVFAERAREITEFCVARGGKVFADWPVPTVFAYVFFHVVDGTVFVVRETCGNKPQIAGVLFAQAINEAEQRRRVAAGENRFQWRRSQETTDAIALAEVVARQDLLPRLARQVEKRWPNWRERKVLTYRGNELVELKPAVLARFLGKADGHQGKK